MMKQTQTMKKIFKHSLTLVAAIIALNIFTLSTTQAAKNINSIAAIVNDDVITSEELQHFIAYNKQRLAQRGAHIPSQKKLRQQTLKQLIDKKLELQLAKRAGINITDKMLTQGIADVAKRNHITVKQLYQQVAAQGIRRSQYRQRIHDEMTISTLLQQEIARDVKITPEDVDKALRELHHQAQAKSQFQVANILYPLSENADKQQVTQAQRTINTIKLNLIGGGSLENIADKYPNTEQHNLGWRSLNELPTVFAKTVKTMKVGSVSNALRTPNGIQLIRLVAKRDDTSYTRLSKKQRLNIARRQAFERKYKQAEKDLLKEVRKSSYIKILVKS